MEIGFVPVIVNTGDQVILFDAGNGVMHGVGCCCCRGLPPPGFTADQIDIVVLTICTPTISPV